MAPERPDKPEVTACGGGLTIDTRSAEAPGWRKAAAIYGVPWLVAIAAASVWYLGWGMPEGFGVRLMVWIVLMSLTAALHALALLTLWGTAYSRGGVETLIIDPVRITLRRQAGRFPIEMHIPRGIVERAEAVPPRADGRPHPRIEVKAWRSALRFGAGMTQGEAEECLYVLNAFFEREEYVRHALTPVAPEATIAPTQAETSAQRTAALTGTSRSMSDHEKRAGTVRARVARWIRRSPQSLGPNGPRRVK
ncbi:MAG: hypothetical protein JW733_05610 [Coriobacteriia bacterium]|nr:hypothetical protein [Coriobacteriia bacterium]MBN2841105.1 hypothetical protein [Coriobacteriia bacterium]